ncbi:MAG: amidohydrolase family protein, partial [Rhodoferax sp.]|nr:amidohydrolase family protein [Rhodoferax sp.]
MTEDLLIHGARLPGGQHIDLLIQGGRIAAAGAGLQAGPQLDRIDATGCLVIPGLVDAHAHIDKTLWGMPWRPHQAGPSLLDRIENERRVMIDLQLSAEKQSARLLRHMVARGT